MADNEVASAPGLDTCHLWASVDGVAAAQDESVIEQNDVLLFLVGKTPTIRNSDTLATTSTDMESPRSTADLSTKVSAEYTALKIQIEDVSLPAKRAPEVEPVSETDSDDDVFTNDRATAAVVPSPQSYNDSMDGTRHAQVVQDQLAHDSMNLRSDSETPPEMQPEDEDMNLTATIGSKLRQRRAPSSKSNGSKSSGTDKPARLPPLRTSRLDSFVTFLTTQRDGLIVALVLCLLLGYCVAIVYRAMHPISYPLPNVDALFTPYDVSNVSARFRSPLVGHSFTEAVMLEWEITNFPVDALQKHGPEPFEYRVLLDDQQLLFDVGVWSLEPEEETMTVINKTIGYRLRPRDIPGLGTHTLRLEVKFAIPGSDDELRTLSDTTEFTFSAPDATAPHLKITSPGDGAMIQGRSFVLEYEAHNMQTLHALVDRKWRVRKEFISDGNLLLRGLSAGAHSIRLEAFDGAGALVATQEIHVELYEEQIL